MSTTIPAYPLQWPTGWKRTPFEARTRARFGKKTQTAGRSYLSHTELTIAQANLRVREELQRMNIRDSDLVVSTNLELRLDGQPRSGQRQPADPGAAVYWRERSNDAPRCMAIDRYDRVEDNLAAIAATLEAMRAIERHGGAAILERAFTGFTGLPATTVHWPDVLGVAAHMPTDHVRDAYRRLRSARHPDAPGGDREAFEEVQAAWDAFCKERGING